MSVFTEIEVAGETLPVAVIRGADKGPRVLVTASSSASKPQGGLQSNSQAGPGPCGAP